MGWKKGQSGNPAGRRPGSSLTLTRELKKVLHSGSGKVAREFADKLVKLSLDGNTQAMKLVLERVDGRVRTAEELAKADAAASVPSDPQQRRQRILDLLRQPELRALLEEVRADEALKAGSSTAAVQ